MNRFLARALPATAVFALAILTVPAWAQTPPAAVSAPAPASQVLNAATRTAKATNKNILLHYSASWCGWCKRLNATLESPDLNKLFTNHFVLVSLDVMESGDKKALENPGAAKHLADMGGAKSGLPFTVFLDKNGKKIADTNVLPGNTNIGYPAAPVEIAAFGKLLAKAAPRMSATERVKITGYLSRHAPQ